MPKNTGEGNCFTHSANSNANIIQKHPYRHTQKNIWAPCGRVSLTCKINHHIRLYFTSGQHIPMASIPSGIRAWATAKVYTVERPDYLSSQCVLTPLGPHLSSPCFQAFALHVLPSGTSGLSPSPSTGFDRSATSSVRLALTIQFKISISLTIHSLPSPLYFLLGIYHRFIFLFCLSVCPT